MEVIPCPFYKRRVYIDAFDRNVSTDDIPLNRFIKMLENVEQQYRGIFMRDFTFDSRLICDNPSLEFFQQKLDQYSQIRFPVFWFNRNPGLMI